MTDERVTREAGPPESSPSALPPPSSLLERPDEGAQLVGRRSGKEAERPPSATLGESVVTREPTDLIEDPEFYMAVQICWNQRRHQVGRAMREEQEQVMFATLDALHRVGYRLTMVPTAAASSPLKGSEPPAPPPVSGTQPVTADGHQKPAPICTACPGPALTGICSHPECDIHKESRAVGEMFRRGDTAGLAAYVNRRGSDRAAVAIARIRGTRWRIRTST